MSRARRSLLLLSALIASACGDLDRSPEIALQQQSQALEQPVESNAPAPGLSRGLVAHWTFDEAAGSSSASDRAGRRDDGALRDSDRGSDFEAGKSSNAFRFRRGAWFAVEPSADLASVRTELTIAGWIKPSGKLGTGAIFAGTTDALSKPQFVLAVEHGRRLRFQGPGATPTLTTGWDALRPHRWSHVAVTWNAQTMTAKLYVDGRVRALDTSFDAAAAAPVGPTSLAAIGCSIDAAQLASPPRAPSAYRCIDGELDELMIYSRALERREIHALSAGQIPDAPVVISTIGRQEGVPPYDPNVPIVVGSDDSARYAYLVVRSPLTLGARATIESLDARIGRVVSRGPGFEAHEVTLLQGNPDEVAAELSALFPSFHDLLPIRNAEKVSFSDDPLVVAGRSKVIVRCGVHASADVCRSSVAPLLDTVLDSHADTVVGLAAPSALPALAALDEVRSVQEMSIPHLTLREARVASRVDAAQAFTSFPVPAERRLSGGGIVIGIYDSGIDPTHPAFFAPGGALLRKEPMSAWFLPKNFLEDISGAEPYYDDHGTHVAGIAAGGGQGHADGTYDHRGVAPAATLFSAETGHYGVLEHGHVVNHSHINDRIGLYNESDADHDRVLHEPWRARDGIYKTIVSAAGNQGRENVMQGRTKGFYSLLNNSKNATIVGNLDDASGAIDESSSQGPTVDGRIKPDLVAPGTNILSTTFASEVYTPGDEAPAFYVEKMGTSMAAPHVAGVAALLHQAAKRNLFECIGSELCRAYDSNALRNASVRAILIHSARDLTLSESDAQARGRPRNPDLGDAPAFYGAGPDFSTGWGMLDAQWATALVERRDYSEHYALRQGEQRTYLFRVGESEPLRITLTWDDPPAMPLQLDADSPATLEELSRLVNDIDMYLIDPDGRAHYPWRIEPFLTGTFESRDGIQPITPQMLRDRVARREAASAVLDASANFDHLNNVERIDVDSPVLGDWRLVVVGRRIAESQHFSLVHRDSLSERDHTRIVYRVRDTGGVMFDWGDDGTTGASNDAAKDLHAIQFATEGWVGNYLGVEGDVAVATGLGDSWTGWYGSDRDLTNYAHLFFPATQVRFRVSNPSPSFQTDYWGVRYRVRNRSTGWTDWGCQGQTLGTPGVPIQAIEMELFTSSEPIVVCPST